jgi:hypothetical protein
MGERFVRMLRLPLPPMGLQTHRTSMADTCTGTKLSLKTEITEILDTKEI